MAARKKATGGRGKQRTSTPPRKTATGGRGKQRKK